MKFLLGVAATLLLGIGCKPVDIPVPVTDSINSEISQKSEQILSYKNTDYNFGFSYPSIANIGQPPFDRDREGLAKISLKFPDNNEVTFNVYNRDGGDIYDYYSDQKNPPSEADRGTEPLHLVGMWTKDGVTTKRYILSFIPHNSKLTTVYVVELKQIGNYLIRIATNSTTHGTVNDFLETSPAIKIFDTVAPLYKHDIVNFNDKTPGAILDGLTVDTHSQLMWDKQVILTREDLGHNLLNSNVEELDKADIGFTEITKFLRDGKIYFYFGAGSGCEGCFWPLSKYLVIDPQTGMITYQELDESKNPYFFERMFGLVVSSNKLKGAYISNGSGSQNKPNEPEVVWVIDFTTGASSVYKKLPLGQTTFEFGNEGGRLEWDKNSEKLIIETFKRQL